MAIFHSSRAGTRGGKDQFNWDTVKSDKDRECYLGHSVMAPTGRWQEGKDLNWYSKDRDAEQHIKSAEFRAAKRIEEEAMMAALGIKVMPPPPPPSAPAAPAASARTKPVAKSTVIKDEPMTPAIHGDPRKAVRQKHDKRKEDRRRRRQLKAAGSDEEKHDWSENDEDDLIHSDDDNNSDGGTENDQAKSMLQPGTMTEKEVDEFLIDLVKKHGLKTIQHILKSKKDKKEKKRKNASPSASGSSSESEDEKKSSKSKHKKKHSHKEEKKSKKRDRSRSSSPSSTKKRSKHRHH